MDLSAQTSNLRFPSTNLTESKANIEEFILECNKVAIENLGLGNFSDTFNLLKKAEQVLISEYQQIPSEKIYRLIGITLNNLGCYYKESNLPKVALKYLKKALNIEVVTVNDQRNIAETHLNICAILSFMKNHIMALEHVKLSLNLLENARKALILDKNGRYLVHPDKVQNSRQLEQFGENRAEDYKSIITTMIIGYYNYGTELEYLQRYRESALAYGKGYELAVDELGETHILTQNLNKNYSSLIFKKKLHEIEIKRKNNQKLKLIQANQNIRFQHKNIQRFKLHEEYPILKRVADYGLDGRKHYKTKILSHLQQSQKKSRSPRRENSEKLPKLSNDTSNIFKMGRAESVGARQSYQSNSEELQKDPAIRNIKKYFDELLPSNNILDQKRVSRSFLYEPAAEISNVSNDRADLNQTINARDHEQSSFQAISDDRTELDFKIHSTKYYFSSTANMNQTRIKSSQRANRLDFSFGNESNASPIMPQKQGVKDLPVLVLKNSVILPKNIRTNSVDNSEQYFSGSRKYSPQPFLTPYKNKDNDSLMNRNIYNTGRNSFELNELEHLTRKKANLSTNQEPFSKESELDIYDSPLFDIAEDFEIKRRTKLVKDYSGERDNIHANDDFEILKGDSYEENKAFRSQIPIDILINGSNSKYDFESQQKSKHPRVNKNSINIKIAEAKESLNKYKKLLDRPQKMSVKTSQATNLNAQSSSNIYNSKRSKNNSALFTLNKPEEKEVN